MASPSNQPDPAPFKEDPNVKMMVDPFEVRMRFTTQLQRLSATVTSSQKAAHYALKYRDLDEDLHSCILEQLERVRDSSLILLISC
jgi:CTD kinase subunit gamma